MLRRWYVALPILLATGYLAATSSGTVSRTYNASTSMIMLGPSRTTFTDTKGVEQTVVVNPYLNLPGTAITIATTLALKEGSPSVRRKVSEAGLSPAYAVIVGKTPVIDISVEAASPELALETVKFVSALIKSDLQKAQDDFNVGAISRLNLQTVVEPDFVPTTTASTVMRVRLTLLGIGGVVAVALALAFEGAAEVRRNRKRRRAERVSAVGDRDAVDSEDLPAGAPLAPGS